MRIVDCHVHVAGEADAASLLRQMDANGVERVLLISAAERRCLRQTRLNLLQTKRLVDVAPDRISGLARLEPTIPGMAGLAEEALCEMGYSGIKIIPDHWFPHEERLEPFWEKMNGLRAAILFHTGILYGFEDGSRFCRPLYLEKLLHYPRVRFAMAHISWPWCEECLAVMGRMRAGAKDDGERAWQSHIDLTPGTPAHIRKQAIANAVSFCGPERLLFGSDDTLPGDLSWQKKIVQSDLRLLDEIGLDAGQKQRIMAGTADELFPPRRS
jgi:predicted TIM-barrel fold metal-dependent hydrolase